MIVVKDNYGIRRDSCEYFNHGAKASPPAK